MEVCSIGFDSLRKKYRPWITHGCMEAEVKESGALHGLGEWLTHLIKMGHVGQATPKLVWDWVK